MAQRPATPKPTRLAHLMRAAFLGPARALESPKLAPSEKAALELRVANGNQTKAPAQQVIFLIPLVGQHHVRDWESVIQRMTQTLRSFQAQDNPNWQAVICCQDNPALPPDPRIHFLTFDDPTSGNDKWRKLRCLNESLPSFATKPCYVMSFDADDLLHPGAVGEMLNRQSPGGYLVEQGLVMDDATQDIALAGRPTISRPLRKPFWKLCGSCMALYHDPTTPQSQTFLSEMTQHEHRMFPYLARLAGKEVVPLNRPSVLYVLNHGENFGARRGRVGFKTRFVQRFKIEDSAVLNRIRQDFTLTGK